jgi:3-hydroxyacyl-[acyl-carrier-protein] dehydratase
MRYILIDKIKRIEFNKQIIATKNVAMSEDFFADHFVGYPVLPGALQVESIAQAATALLEVSSNFKLKALLTIIEKAKFRELIRPGNELTITVNLLSMHEESALAEGLISLKGKIVTEGRFIFVLKPAEKFYPSKTKAFIESTYDYWLEGAEYAGFENKKEVSNE